MHFVPVPMATTSFTAEGRKAGHATGEEQGPSGRAPAPPFPSTPCRGPHREAPRHLPLAPPAPLPPAQSTRACRGPASPASAAALHNGGSRGPPLGRRPTWPRPEGGRTGPVPAGTKDGIKVPQKQEHGVVPAPGGGGTRPWFSVVWRGWRRPDPPPSELPLARRRRQGAASQGWERGDSVPVSAMLGA